jgi:hypothetical protein
MPAEHAKPNTYSAARTTNRSEAGIYGAKLAHHVRLDRAPSLVTRSMRKNELSGTESVCEAINHGMTDQMPYRDAFLAVVNLVPTDKDLKNDGRPVRSGHEQIDRRSF